MNWTAFWIGISIIYLLGGIAMSIAFTVLMYKDGIKLNFRAFCAVWGLNILIWPVISVWFVYDKIKWG